MRVSQPPTLFGYRRAKGWTPTDYLLVLALQLYEESLCRCGFPVWMGHNEDYAGEALFERDYAHCLICEKVDGADPKKDDAGDGDILRVKNELYERFAPRWARRLAKLG